MMNTDKKTVTTTATHYTLEDGRVIEMPAGLPVERATNLPDSDKLYWISEIPAEMLSDATIESHFRNIGFLVHGNFVS